MTSWLVAQLSIHIYREPPFYSIKPCTILLQLGNFREQHSTMMPSKAILVCLSALYLSRFINALPIPRNHDSQLIDIALRQVYMLKQVTCARNNFRCYNVLDLIYVNSIRAAQRYSILHSHHSLMLEIGTEAMLMAAVGHSEKMAAANKLNYTNPNRLDLGCGSKLTRMFLANASTKNTTINVPDYAALCITKLQDKNFGYRSTIISHEGEIILGVFMDKNDNVWCTQLLAKDTKFSETGDCKRSRGEPSPILEESSAPEPSPLVEESLEAAL